MLFYVDYVLDNNSVTPNGTELTIQCKCENCDYWDEHPSIAHARPTGLCRKSSSIWRPTEFTDWCGEHSKHFK